MDQKFIVRKGCLEDANAIKALAEEEKSSLGFITLGTFIHALENGQIMVVTIDNQVVGFQHYYHRKRDGQSTLYHKAVKQNHRYKGLGTALVDAVKREAEELGKELLLLKCPVDLQSNDFHSKYGFKLRGVEDGKKRALNVWIYELD